MVSRVLYRERFDNLTLCLKMFEDNIYRFRARVWDLSGLPLMSVEDVEDVEVQRPWSFLFRRAPHVLLLVVCEPYFPPTSKGSFDGISTLKLFLGLKTA